jgi:hypothetical protein
MLYNRYRELGILARANKIKLAAASELREIDKYKSSSSAEDLLVGSRLLKQYVRD